MVWVLAVQTVVSGSLVTKANDPMSEADARYLSRPVTRRGARQRPKESFSNGVPLRQVAMWGALADALIGSPLRRFYQASIALQAPSQGRNAILELVRGVSEITCRERCAPACICYHPTSCRRWLVVLRPQR